jgi:hypothetical protein
LRFQRLELVEVSAECCQKLLLFDVLLALSELVPRPGFRRRNHSGRLNALWFRLKLGCGRDGYESVDKIHEQFIRTQPGWPCSALGGSSTVFIHKNLEKPGEVIKDNSMGFGNIPCLEFPSAFVLSYGMILLVKMVAVQVFYIGLPYKMGQANHSTHSIDTQ